jgi:hypothetical protein
MVAPRKQDPINRSGMATWTELEYRAILFAAAGRSRARFIREELIDREKLAELVRAYQANQKPERN